MSSGLAGRVFAVLAIFLVCLALTLGAFAQSTTEGAVSGTITDPNGAVVPNASVVIHNNGTNAEITVTSDGTGFFRSPNLNPAVYTVTVTAPGFAPYKATNVTITVGSMTDLGIKLAVGSTTQTVDVTAEAAQVNTTSADFAPTVNQTAISNLPINGGRWSNFVLLTPGAVTNSSGFGLVSFRGQSELLNNNTVDGADNNQAFFSEERGRTRGAYAFAKESVQEFQVNVSNYSAEYGRSAGGVINSVTKSGTNAYHGEMYFYDRDNNWGAINPFTKIVTQDSPGVFNTHFYKPKDWRKKAGVAIGGPVVKDKLFFFVNYDWNNRNFPGTSIASTPTNTAKTGFFDPPSASSIGTLASRVYGVSNAATQAQATALYNTDLAALITTLGPVPRTGENIIWFGKMDWQANQKNHVSFSLDRQRWASPAGIQTQATNNYGTKSFGNDYVKVTTGIAKLDTYFTSNLANELRVSYGRDFEFENPQTPTTPYEDANLNHSAIFPSYSNPLPYPPNVFITNGWNLGTSTFLNRPKYPSEYRQQYADTATWVHGKHTFKFGEDYTRVLDDTVNLFQQFGTFSYSNLVNYFSDLNKANTCSLNMGGGVTRPVPCYSSFSQGFGTPGAKFSTNDYGFFVQDDWRLYPRLTVNLGLRWDYEKLPNPQLPNAAVPLTTQMPSDKNNFGPRVGFAFDVFGNGKTSLRAGYGIYYGRMINGAIYAALLNTGLTNGQIQYTMNTNSTATGPCAPAFPQVLTGPPNCSGSGSINFFDKHFQNPQIHQIDLSLEQEIGWNTVFSLHYLGSYGRELPYSTDVNLAPATKTITYKVCGVNNEGVGSQGTVCTTGAQGGQPVQAATVTVPLYTGRLNTAFGSLNEFLSEGTSNYNALVFQLNHRMAKHVQFMSNFTWSHAIDYGTSTGTTGGPSNILDPYNLAGEKGNSNNNVPLRFVFSAVGQSPWHVNHHVLSYLANDWQIAPIFAWQNGLAYSAGTSGSASCPAGAPAAVCTAGGFGSGMIGSSGTGRLFGPRNQFHQPNTQNIDVKLSKMIRVRERYSLELSGEAFNLLNHQNVTGVNSTAYFVGTCAANAAAPGGSNCAGGYIGPTLTYNTGVFGSVTGANGNFAYSQRQVQVGVRVKF